MQRTTDKESDKDGVLSSATISSGYSKPCQQLSDFDDLDPFGQGTHHYSVLCHITNGSERPNTGVLAPVLPVA